MRAFVLTSPFRAVIFAADGAQAAKLLNRQFEATIGRKPKGTRKRGGSVQPGDLTELNTKKAKAWILDPGG